MLNWYYLLIVNIDSYSLHFMWITFLFYFIIHRIIISIACALVCIYMYEHHIAASVKTMTSFKRNVMNGHQCTSAMHGKHMHAHGKELEKMGGKRWSFFFFCYSVPVSLFVWSVIFVCRKVKNEGGSVIKTNEAESLWRLQNSFIQLYNTPWIKTMKISVTICI